jgi:acyl-CoA synthetase (AMP-forming)/AMP-acid ligase II
MAEGYGLAETAGAVAFKLHLGIGPSDVVGLPVPGYRWRVVGEDGRDVRRGQIGELWVRGPGVTKGYWGDAAASADVLTRDGWLRTGDLARRGVLGEVHFAGRSKDVIKRGGFSVYAVEVETVLGQHPAVAEAAVVGIPDDILGEVPAAAVRLRPGTTVSEADLIAFAGEHLSSYKKPTRVVFVADLPRTGTQKVAKRQLLPLFA